MDKAFLGVGCSYLIWRIFYLIGRMFYQLQSCTNLLQKHNQVTSIMMRIMRESWVYFKITRVWEQFGQMKKETGTYTLRIWVSITTPKNNENSMCRILNNSSKRKTNIKTTITRTWIRMQKHTKNTITITNSNTTIHLRPTYLGERRPGRSTIQWKEIY